MESAGGIPSLYPSWRPMLLMVWMAVSLQPPRDLATKGMNVTPTERQAPTWATIFLSSPTERAWAWVVAAPVTVSVCKGEITITSSVASRCRLQRGRYRSAGQLLDPGIREGTSLPGAKAADCAAENKASRRVMLEDPVTIPPTAYLVIT